MIKRLFTDHPSSIRESYTQHMRFSLYLGFQGLKMFVAATTHAIFPFIFKETTTTLITKTQYKIQERFKKADKKLKKVS